MKLYKSPDNNVYAFEEDGSQDHLILKNFVSITELEADVIRLEIQRKTFDALPYDVKREMEYPSLKEQTNALLVGGSELETLKSKIQAINDKYPPS
jgi:hypothetical protein